MQVSGSRVNTYAHEYPEGEEYADGKARRLKFKDASGAVVHQVYEVECLDKSKSVMDGYWEEAGGSRLYSGTGDEFTPFEKGLGLFNMSTRGTLRFVENGVQLAKIYVHHDSYP